MGTFLPLNISGFRMRSELLKTTGDLRVRNVFAQRRNETYPSWSALCLPPTGRTVEDMLLIKWPQHLKHLTVRLRPRVSQRHMDKTPRVTFLVGDCPLKATKTALLQRCRKEFGPEATVTGFDEHPNVYRIDVPARHAAEIDQAMNDDGGRVSLFGHRIVIGRTLESVLNVEFTATMSSMVQRLESVEKHVGVSGGGPRRAITGSVRGRGRGASSSPSSSN